MAQSRTVNGQAGQQPSRYASPKPFPPQHPPLPPTAIIRTAQERKRTSGTGLATCAEAALVVTDLLATILGEAKARMGVALVRRAARENMVMAVGKRVQLDVAVR